MKALAVLAALIPVAAFADLPPPKLTFGSAVSWPQISKFRPAAHLSMGKLHVQLEKTTLANITFAVGHGRISHQGDAAGSEYWLCYSLPHQRLWIISNGEMGGNDHAVTEIIARQQVSKPTQQCPELPRSFQPVSNRGTVWLGSTQKVVSKVLGPASHVEGAWRAYNYNGKVPGFCKPSGYDQMNWAVVKFHHRSVVLIAVGQVTSC